MERLYDAFMEAWKAGNEGLFVNAGIAWIKDCDNPFEVGTPERDYFFQAKRGYTRWQLGGIDNRYGRRVMVENLKKLAELDKMNPYRPAGFRMLGVVPDEVTLVDEAEAIAGSTQKVIEEIEVNTAPDLPAVEDAVDEPIEEIAEKPAEKKRRNKEPMHVLGVQHEKKGLFGRHKE